MIETKTNLALRGFFFNFRLTLKHWQDLAGGRNIRRAKALLLGPRVHRTRCKHHHDRGSVAGGPQGASATQCWGEAEQAELRREVLASAEVGITFSVPVNSQNLELQIPEQNGIEGIVLKDDDDCAVVIRRADLEPDRLFGKEDELGGAPALQKLREIEEHFDDLLYLRIHNFFSVLCPVVPCPTEWDSRDSWDKFDIFCGFVHSRGTGVGCQPGQVRDHPSKEQQHLGIQVKCREQSEESPDFPEVSHSGTMTGKEWDNRQEGQGNRPGSEQSVCRRCRCVLPAPQAWP